MKNSKTVWYTICTITLLLISAQVSAQPWFEQVWTCTVNEGHTFGEFNAVHGKWIKWANKQSYGGDIQGYISQSVVASEFKVYLIDSYPNVATYAADITTFFDSF